jgi:hypothetical protein
MRIPKFVYLSVEEDLSIADFAEQLRLNFGGVGLQ